MSQFQIPPGHIPGIEYSIPRQSQRPGMITTIGIMSVIVGCLTLFGSFIVGLQSFSLFGVARMSATAQASVTPPAAVAVGPVTSVSTAPDDGDAPADPPDSQQGISVAASKVVADGVHSFHRLSKTRREQFENFLQQAGTVSGLAPDDSGNLPNVKQTVLEDRTMPAVTAGALPTDVLVTAYGRIEIYDEGVAFMPSDGSPAMRTAIGTVGVTAIGAGANPAASGALKPAEAQAVITTLQTNCPNVLNPAQITTLTAALQKPGQTLITPGSTANQFTYAYANGDSTVTVMLNGGQITIDAAGKEVAQNTVAGPFASPILSMKVDMKAFAIVIFETILSGVLAVYLIVSGILVLRQSPIGSKLHWIYVALKIPLAITGAIALPWMWFTFFSSMQSGMPGGGGPSSTNGWVIFGVVLGALAIAYPIGLVFALSSRTVRGYYHSVVPG